MSYSILVLCTGNMGRSPLAEAILRKRLADALDMDGSNLAEAGVHVASAGILAPEGLGPSRRGIALAAEFGIDMSLHRTTRVDSALVRQADLVLCMDFDQVGEIRTRFGVEADLLDPEGEEIPDPRDRDDAFFATVRDRIDAAVTARLPDLLADVRRRSD